MGTKSNFFTYVTEEINKYKGVAVPVRAGFLERHLVRKLPPKKLHPNPDDEFCDPLIGPNDEIIGKYAKSIKEARFHSLKEDFEEPLMIEKMEPDGYMLMNGHHRWAAAIRMSVKRVPVSIVNLTTLADVEKMLEHAKNDARVSLDLDEVVFLSKDGGPAEKAAPFPMNLFYKQRLRRGIPALFHFLHTRGYDIWVYSSNCYSMDYVRSLMRVHRARVDGIITGTGKNNMNPEEKKQLEDLIANKYASTIHVDLDSLVLIDSKNKEFKDIPLNCTDETWSRAVMDGVGELRKL